MMAKFELMRQQDSTEQIKMDPQQMMKKYTKINSEQ